MSGWHLAQLNVGRVRYPPEDPRMHGFMSRLDEINALADASPGFVWRLQSDQGNATDILVTDDPMFLINLSVWENADALSEFVYGTDHVTVMAGRQAWFEPHRAAYQVLWWIVQGRLPSAGEALERLERVHADGPTPYAFTFETRFPPPD